MDLALLIGILVDLYYLALMKPVPLFSFSGFHLGVLVCMFGAGSVYVIDRYDSVSTTDEPVIPFREIYKRYRTQLSILLLCLTVILLSRPTRFESASILVTLPAHFTASIFILVYDRDFEANAWRPIKTLLLELTKTETPPVFSVHPSFKDGSFTYKASLTPDPKDSAMPMDLHQTPFVVLASITNPSNSSYQWLNRTDLDQLHDGFLLSRINLARLERTANIHGLICMLFSGQIRDRLAIPRLVKTSAVHTLNLNFMGTPPQNLEKIWLRMSFDFQKTTENATDLVKMLMGGSYKGEEKVITRLVKQLLNSTKDKESLPPLISLGQLVIMSRTSVDHLEEEDWLFVNQSYARACDIYARACDSIDNNPNVDFFDPKDNFTSILKYMVNLYGDVYSRPIHEFIEYHDQLVKMSHTDSDLGPILDDILEGMMSQLDTSVEPKKLYHVHEVKNRRKHVVVGTTFALAILSRMHGGGK